MNGAALGGISTAEITVDGIEPRNVVLYFHGGVYVMGDAFLAADLASQSTSLTDCEEDRTLRAVLVGMLREGDQNAC